MAHNNTILSQLLKLVSRHEFESLAKIHHEGRSLVAVCDVNDGAVIRTK